MQGRRFVSTIKDISTLTPLGADKCFVKHYTKLL